MTVPGLFPGREIGIWLVGLLVALFILTWVLIARKKHLLPLRYIEGLSGLEQLIQSCAEKGRPMLWTGMTSPGQGGYKGVSVWAAASMSLVRWATEKLAKFSIGFWSTCSQPMAQQAMAQVAREGYTAGGHPEAFDINKIQFTYSSAWVLTTLSIIEQVHPAAMVMLGTGTHVQAIMFKQVRAYGGLVLAGSYDDAVQAMCAAFGDYVIIGPEIFAMAALATQNPETNASVAAQDLFTMIVCYGVVIVGAVAFVLKLAVPWR